MRTVATCFLIATGMDYCGLSVRVCVCLCLSVDHDREPCKTAESIEIPFGEQTRVGRRNHVVSVVYWRYLAHTIEHCMFGGGGNAIASVRPSVRLFPLCLRNRLTIDHELLRVSRSWP